MRLYGFLFFGIASNMVGATAFSPSGQAEKTSGTSLSSYLDSMNPNGIAAPKPASYGISGKSYTNVPSSPFDGQASANGAAAAFFPFAKADYFDTSYLVSKGPRATFDWGAPADATRKLGDDGLLRAGAWYCTNGGWESPNPKAATEVFWVLSGHGKLTDADGVEHHFGPGDNVIIPKGHTGRWDVYEPIHKVWAVNAHANIEETGSPIRVQVDHYHSWNEELLSALTVDNGVVVDDPLYGPFLQSSNGAAPSAKVFYNVGPTQVGVWSSAAGSSYRVQQGERAWIYCLEGVMFVTDGRTGEARRCEAGDTIVVPQGWYGYVDVVEGTKQLFTVAK
mmetsp:Transcript_5570/g.13119  ORF Transcript_5570/g.13119 Transcript_5570/m.13119 type:complete len:336 (+) Transcript_5570:66-1073(+)